MKKIQLQKSQKEKNQFSEITGKNEITKKQKQTIERLVRKLEEDAKEIKDLKYTINIINTLSKDR